MFLHLAPLELLKRRFRLVLFAGLVVGILAVAVSLLFPLQYRADAQILIISKTRYGVDPYTAIKSAERVGENLVQVVKTNDFFSKTMSQAGYNIDKTPFENVTERVKRQRWQKALNVSVVYGTGVLNISAYNKDKGQAEQLAAAAANALTVSGWEYVGGDVGFKVVNEAVGTRFPVRPNLIINFVLGFVVGVILVLFFVLRRYKTV